MFVRTQLLEDVLQVNWMEMENLFRNISSPVNKAPFQAVSIPPDAPMEGKYSNLLNLCGQTLCIYAKSKVSLLVSCKHTIPAALSSTFFLIANHLSEELMPLTFQFKIFHVVLLFINNQFDVTVVSRVHPLMTIPGHKIIGIHKKDKTLKACGNIPAGDISRWAGEPKQPHMMARNFHSIR